jgi:NosR/NirI family transcriptional regulator, nitrous oxide reductase regulator
VIQPDDPWGFEEEPVETWSDLLSAQASDILPLAAFLLLAYVSFHRKSVRLKYVTLAVSVLYMGFAKSNLLSITDVFRVIDWSFPPLKHNVAWYLFAGFTVVSTVLWGRFYCGRVCAYGAFTQLMDAVLPSSWRIEVPKAIEKRAGYIKFGILAAVLTYYAATHNTMVYRYVEPFWMFGRSESSLLLWGMLGVLLVATVFVRNLYCRVLCPLGATLGVISFLTVFRIKRWSECTTCKICEKTCEWGAIEGPRIIQTECVRCDDCERVYADEAKCPHWRILDYKKRKGGTIPLTPVRG